MKKDDNLEDLFKDKFKDFEADVKPDVWKNIQTALKGFGLGFIIKALINKVGTSTLVAVVSSAAAVLGTVLVMHWAEDKKTDTVENKPATTQTIAQQTVPASTDNVDAKEEIKPTITEPTENKNTALESNSTTKNNTVDKKEMESVINKYSKTPVADIFASPVAGELPLQVSLMNKGTGKVNKWTFGDSKQIETETSPIHFYNEPGVYTVKLISTDAEGKTSVDSTTIEVVGNPSIPSAPTEISPDGDGDKDEFVINPINIKDIDVVIFDKLGTVVCRWEGTDGKWDGKNLKGKPVNEGMYFYIINAVGLGGKKFEKHGSIKLTRKKLPKH